MRRAKAMFRPGSLECSLIALSIALSITLTSGEDNAPEHGSPARVAELLKELELPESTDLQRRRDAARELSQMHPLPPEAIAVLAKALDTFDTGIFCVLDTKILGALYVEVRPAEDALGRSRSRRDFHNRR